MTPGKYDLTIYCGSTWNEDSVKFVYKVEGQPVNLTGYTARAVGVSQWDGRPYFDISSTDGSLILGGVAGVDSPQPVITADFRDVAAEHPNVPFV